MHYESAMMGTGHWSRVVRLVALAVAVLSLGAPAFADTATLYPTTATPTGVVTNPDSALADDGSGALVSSNTSSLVVAGFPNTNLGTLSNVTVWVKYRTSAAPADDTYQCDAAVNGTTFNQTILAATTSNQASYTTASLSLGTLTWAEVGTLAIQCSTTKNRGADGYNLDLDVGYSVATYTPAATTTLGDGSDPTASPTLCPAPDGGATMLDAFSFVTSAGSDNVDDVTVTFAAGTAAALSLVEITNVAGTVVYGSTANPASDTVLIDLSGGSVLTATTTLTEYRVRITPKTHTNLPSATTYTVTGTVTAFTPASNVTAGSDVDSDTVTIDNAPPSDATWGVVTAGDAEVVLNWSNPGADFDSVVILRSTATIGDAPVEGTTYTQGNTIGSSVVVYAGSATSFTDNATNNASNPPVNDTTYYYKVFARDGCANYAAGTETGPHTPRATTTLGDGTDPSASPTLCPAGGESAGGPTMLDAFSFVTSNGSDAVDDVTVSFAVGTAEALSLVEITNEAGTTVYGSTANPASDTVLIDLTGAPVLTATTSPTEYRVRITPKTHANMPSATTYSVTGIVTAFTPASNNSGGADIDSDTVTIGNEAPPTASWSTVTAGDSEIVLNWTSALEVLILRSTATISDVPTEGQAYAPGNTIGASTVVYAAVGSTYTDTAPVNATTYYYKIFTRDGCANYSAGVQTGPHTPQGTTTVGDGTDPSAAPSLCPGDGATELDAFSLQTSNDDDTVTAVEVSFAAGTAASLSLVEITGNGGSPVYGSQINPSDTQSVTLSTPITATTGLTQYKVRITPKANADLPGPPGSTYTVTGTVTGITSSNLKSYNEVDSDTVTIDNLAPDNATWGTITPDASEVALSWTNPVTDFNSVVILRSTASIGDAPIEGQTYSQGNTVGSSVVVYVGAAGSFVDNAANNPSNPPINGTDYYYKIFAGDACLNYASGAQTGPHTPTGAPTTTVGDGVDPSNIAGLCPGGGTVDLDTFTLQTSTGSDDVTALEVSFAAGTAAAVSQMLITSNDGIAVYGTVNSPADTQPVSLSPSISATTTEVPYKIRISPKGHAELPAPPGSDINVTATVTAITSANDPVYNDVDSATVTIDNLVPPEDASWGTVTPGDNQIELQWTNPNQPSQKDFFGVMILRNTVPITDQPTEGLTYVKGSTFPGGSIVVYSYTGTTPATSLLDDDANLPGNAPANGTDYYYKIFVLDYCHNWTQGGVQTGPHTPQATTTVGNGTDPAVAPSLCPDDGATELDAFTLVASSGSDTITALQVTFAAGTTAGLSLVEITGNGGSPVYGSVANPADTQSISLGAGIGVTTSPAQYKVRVTPKAHADMPAPPGASYLVTGTVTAITSGNLPVYDDTGSDTVTIDNLAPANASWGTVTTNDSQVSLAWSNPGGDFDSVVILRSTTTIGDLPVEGSAYSQGTAIGSSLVVYAGSGSSFVDNATNNPGSPPVNGTAYYYKIFAKDACGNYAAGVETGPHTPNAATVITVGNGTDPGNTAQLCPSGSATELDAFTLATNTGTDTVTSVTVKFATGTAAGLSKVEITSNNGSTIYGTLGPNPAPTDTTVISLSPSLVATTSATQYKVRVTPKTHANMPASPGASYAVTGRVTAIASTFPKVYNDSASATVTVDNLSPANPTWGTITKLDGQIDLAWTNPGADFQKTLVSRSISEPGAGAPTEGSDPIPTDPVGNGTAVYSGVGIGHPDTGLNNGSLYWYRAFARDACGNWSHQGAGTGPHVPAAPGTTVADADITVEASSCKQLTITAPFKGDADNDGQAVVTVDAATKCTLTGASPRRCTVAVNPTGSDLPISYTVNVSFSDPDGVTGDASVNRSPQAPGCTALNTSAPIVEILRPGNLHAVGDPVTARVKISDTDGFGGSPVTWRTYPQGGSPGSFIATGLTRKTTEEANFGCPGTLNCQIWDISISIPSQGYYNLEVKATDSNSSTGAAAITLWRSNVPGMGTLLVQTGGQQLCINCHELKTHACDQNCDEQSYWAISCDTCHTPHGTRNLSGIREQIETPNSGLRDVAFGTRVGAVADYTTDPDCSALTGEAKKACSSYANETGTLGPCQACHTLTSEPGGAPRWRNTGDSGLHYPAASTTQCTACHTHEAGFSGAGAACNTCHNAPPTIGKHGTHDQVWDSTEGNLPTSYEEATSHASTTQYGFPCAKCHSGGHINDSAHDGTTTSPWQVEVDGAFDTTTDPQNPGGTYSATYNQSQEQGPIGQYWSYSDGTCGNLYCHSRANPLGGTNQFATVTWETGSITDCISCHDTRGSVATPTDLSPAHQKHTATDLYDLQCTRCHDLTVDVDTAIADKREHVDGQKDVVFDATAPSNAAITYPGNPTYTCSGTYCHSDGTDNDPSGGYTSPNADLSWNGGSSNCRSCHSGDATTTPTMASGKHTNHIDNLTSGGGVLGVNYECATCHDATVSSGDNGTITNVANHVNGTRNVQGLVVGGENVVGTWSSPSCASSYCHSSGQNPATNTLQYYDPSWAAGSLDCKGCHGRYTPADFTSAAGEPNYANGGAGAADANSHQRHVASAADCTKCHNTTTANGTQISTGSVLHTNQSRNVAISSSFDTNGATSNYTAATKTCNNIACHGSGTPQWGSTLVCLDCHDGPDGGTLGDGAPNGVGDEWTTAATGSVGHGGVTGSGGTSGPLTSALGGCDYCHQLNASHTPTAGTNPYRLRFTVTDNTLCLQCHLTGDSGISQNSEGTTLTARNGAKNVDTAHYGAKHQSGEGGQLCWDCHDPHGVPSNLLMVKSSVSVVSDAYGIPGSGTDQTHTVVLTGNGGGTSGVLDHRLDYVQTSGGTPRQGICQACHNPAKGTDPTTGSTKYWRWDGTDATGTSGDHPSAGSVAPCSDCHAHTDNFKGVGGGPDCRSCHDDGEGSRRAIVNDFADGTSPNFRSHHVGNGTANTLRGTLTNNDCYVCHAEAVLDAGDPSGYNTGDLHMNGVIDLRNADTASASFPYDKSGMPASAADWNSSNATWRTQTSTNLDPFCLSCHDSNGAAGVSSFYESGAAAQNPFKDTRLAVAGITNNYDQLLRPNVTDIKSKVSGGPPAQGSFSRHAIRGQSTSKYAQYLTATAWPSNPNGYSTIYSASRFTSMGTDESGRPNWNDSSVMGCADCHTTDGANGTSGNAHGSNSEYLLKNSSGTATEGTYAGGTYNCFRCHPSGSYDQGHTGGNGSDFQDTVTQVGNARITGASKGYGTIFGIACMNCHGGAQGNGTGTGDTNGFGWIHGTSQVFVKTGGGTRNAYRFMNGGGLRYYAPGNNTTWDTGAGTCYTLSAGDTWSGCTQHGSKTVGTSSLKRPLSY